MHYQFFLNGVKTVDVVVGSAQWDKVVKAGKWWSFPEFGLNKSGRIGLQDHGSKVWYRNIKVKPI